MIVKGLPGTVVLRPGVGLSPGLRLDLQSKLWLEATHIRYPKLDEVIVAPVLIRQSSIDALLAVDLDDALEEAVLTAEAEEVARWITVAV